MNIKIIPNDKGNPPGKLADAELHFTSGPLEGLKLIGFGVWGRRGGGRNVTFPARAYVVNGERRSFALLRPAIDNGEGQECIKTLILEEYAKQETEAQLHPPAMDDAAAPRRGPWLRLQLVGGRADGAPQDRRVRGPS